jgi:flavorubredoxin
MINYVKEAKLLISQDAFGQHLASSARFDDEFVDCHSQFELEDAIADYYANILMPFGKLIKTKIDDIVKLGLEIDMIAPDHGIIWRKDPGKIIQMYLDMAGGKAKENVVIVYDTMWHSTELMTVPLVRGIRDAGVDCTVVKHRSPRYIAIKEFWKARGSCGVPTMNNIMFPSLAEFLYPPWSRTETQRQDRGPSHIGWGGGAVKKAYKSFKQMDLKRLNPAYSPLQNLHLK